MSDIRIRDLSYSYPGGAAAIKGISLHIAAGEKVGLVGANGAGKSTLMYHLNGILPCSTSVNVGGITLTKKSLPRIRQLVGMVFQNPDDQLFCSSVYEDIAFGLRNMGLKEEEVAGRVTESLAEVGLPRFGDKSAPHLSAGEKKRAALATVLAMSPSVLCLDEPAAALDPKGKRELVELLHTLPMTQLIISHDFELIKALCDKVFILHKGTIAATGNPATLLTDIPLLKQTDLY